MTEYLLFLTKQQNIITDQWKEEKKDYNRRYYAHVTLLWSLTCVFLFQQVSFEWCYSVCCPLFSVFSNPSWWRRMATLPESGSDGGFFLLKGSCSSPQSPRARSGWEIGPKTIFGAICWFPLMGNCF